MSKMKNLVVFFSLSTSLLAWSDGGDPDYYKKKLSTSCEKVDLAITTWVDTTDLIGVAEHMQAQTPDKTKVSQLEFLALAVPERKQKQIDLLAESYADISQLLQSKDTTCRTPSSVNYGTTVLYLVKCKNKIIGQIAFEHTMYIKDSKAPTDVRDVLKDVIVKYEQQTKGLKQLKCNFTAAASRYEERNAGSPVPSSSTKQEVPLKQGNGVK